MSKKKSVPHVKKKRPPTLPKAEVKVLRLDLGCGKNKAAGFTGVDELPMPGVDIVADLRKPWPWADSSVDEVNCSHFLEHLERLERVHFCNELYRVLKNGAKATITTPNWSSSRAYGDPTHKWPPVSEFMNYYLDRPWRKANAPHTDAEFVPGMFDCDFGVTWGFSLHPQIAQKNTEQQQFAIQFYKEACQDQIGTWVARKP